jgi:signal transduction histidine kinase
MLRRSLRAKLFISYLIVILVGILVLAASARLVIPSAFDHHMSTMMNGGMMGSNMMANAMAGDLFTNFRNGVNEALLKAGLAAFAVAVGVSIFVSRQVLAPIREIKTASQYIAAGHYEQRVRVPQNLPEEDMDELAQLSLSFNRMAENLAQNEAIRRQLIADVSHELRTPLTTIKGSLEGLLDGVLPPTPETFQQIHKEAGRLQRLVADLQELSRVEASSFHLELKPISLAQLIDSVAQRLGQQFAEKGVTLDIEPLPSLPAVLADEDRTTQVLINLVGNALQYTPSGGRVSVTASTTGSEVHIRIQDTGIGISPEHLTHIFTRFYRVEKSRSRVGGGSGIGLTIAKHLVEAQGGRIWAESKGGGEGSTFTFTLPLDT